MRRLIVLLVFFIFIFSFNPICFAETIYEDPESDIRFTVPDGWINLPFGEHDTIKVCFLYNEFKPNSTDYAKFEYTFIDIYPTMPIEAQREYARKEINNDFFSISAIASLLNVSEDTIQKETYASTDYFSVKTTIYGESKRSGTSKKVTPGQKGKILLRIDNGFMYMFSYSVSVMSPSSRTQECEDIMRSIVYSASSVPKKQSTIAPTASNTGLGAGPTIIPWKKEVPTTVEIDNSSLFLALKIILASVCVLGTGLGIHKRRKRNSGK